jgi:hypothetical protein
MATMVAMSGIGKLHLSVELCSFICLFLLKCSGSSGVCIVLSATHGRLQFLL